MTNAKIVGQINPLDLYRHGIIDNSYYESLVDKEAFLIIKWVLGTGELFSPLYYYEYGESEISFLDELHEIGVSFSHFEKDVWDRIQQLMPC